MPETWGMFTEEPAIQCQAVLLRQVSNDSDESLLFFSILFLLLFYFILFFCLFAFSRATPMAHGGSQARGRIGAIATGYSHINAGSKPRLRPAPQLTAMPEP